MWPFNLAKFRKFLISRILRVFGAVFSTEKLRCVSRDLFGMLFAILIFELNLPFCKAYSLCIVANFAYFRKLVISPILSVFWSHFLYKTTLTSLCKMVDFQNGLISRIFSVF